MLTSYKIEAKTQDELNEKIKSQFNCEDEQYFTYEIEEVKGLFKNKSIKADVILKNEVIAYCKEFFKKMADLMNIEINSEINFHDNQLKIVLASSHNNVLIGKDGKTLTSMMVILKHSLECAKYGMFLDLDVQNYKHKKIKRLEKEIKNICKEVLITKSEVKLDPMNSYERRMVHTIATTFEKLKTESFGEKEERYTIIKYVD